MFIDIILILSYVLICLAAAAAIILPTINAISDPSSLVTAGIGLGGLAVVFLISWAISGNEVLTSYAGFGIDAGLSKFVGGALTMMYLLSFIAIIGIVFTEISKVFK